MRSQLDQTSYCSRTVSIIRAHSSGSSNVHFQIAGQCNLPPLTLTGKSTVAMFVLFAQLFAHEKNMSEQNKRHSEHMSIHQSRGRLIRFRNVYSRERHIFASSMAKRCAIKFEFIMFSIQFYCWAFAIFNGIQFARLLDTKQQQRDRIQIKRVFRIALNQQRNVKIKCKFLP